MLTSGEVSIDPSAAIASGVLLQADRGSQLKIGAGVSIATGAVLHAHSGALVIEPGASIGSGVLLIGAGRVGATACIGAEATILNPAIAPGETVPPKSLLGDTSRQVDLATASQHPTPPPATPTAAPVSTGGLATTAPISLAPSPVYGQAALQQLLSTMFPYRQATLDNPSPPSNS
ncbi:MAG: carbon dioxide concentrating mechanism protein [Cyanobacteria bacterium J069]|nr:MAG: transferase [Cyanobacteria bacterium J069]